MYIANGSSQVSFRDCNRNRKTTSSYIDIVMNELFWQQPSYWPTFFCVIKMSNSDWLSANISRICLARSFTNDGYKMKKIVNSKPDSLEILLFFTATSDRPFISLRVQQFETECSFDFVYLYDGCNSTRRAMAALSGDFGSLSRRTFTATSGCVRVFSFLVLC